MRNRDLIWVVAVLGCVALAAGLCPRQRSPLHGRFAHLEGRWVNRQSRVALELHQLGTRVWGNFEVSNPPLLQLELGQQGEASGTVTRNSENTTICKAVCNSTVNGFQLETSTHDCAWDGEYLPASDLSGRWVRPDGTVVQFQQNADLLEGTCDSPRYGHRLHLRFVDSRQARGSMERTLKGQALTTVCSMRLTREGDGFRMGIDGTDGRSDLPKGYREEFLYTRAR